jgi:hypothetical protein
MARRMRAEAKVFTAAPQARRKFDTNAMPADPNPVGGMPMPGLRPVRAGGECVR